MKLTSFFDFRERPYDLLGITALVLFLISFTTPTDAFDINMHDTYFVAKNVSLYKIASGILLFLWALNMLFRQNILSVKLSRVTVGGTILSFVIVFIVLLIYKEAPGPPRRYYAFSEFQKMQPWYQDRKTIIAICALTAILLFIISQLAFIVNVIAGWYCKFSSNSASKA